MSLDVRGTSPELVVFFLTLGWTPVRRALGISSCVEESALSMSQVRNFQFPTIIKMTEPALLVQL